MTPNPLKFIFLKASTGSLFALNQCQKLMPYLCNEILLSALSAKFAF